jgi:hypothetical protein
LNSDENYFVVAWSTPEMDDSKYGPDIYLTGVRINGSYSHLMDLTELTIGMEQWYRDLMEQLGVPCPKGERPELRYHACFPVTGFSDPAFNADIYEYAVSDDGSVILT